MTVRNELDNVEGFLAPGFEMVGREFADLLADDLDYSAQFCAYIRGEQVVDIWGGPDIDGDSIQGVFSSTKGVAGVCIALLLERGLLDLDAAMSRYWGEFAQGGKGAVTVRVALSHQAGLVGVEPQVSVDQLIDHEYMAARVAAQVPHWVPGAAHGYHALTLGVLMDELVRRIDGRSIATFFREEIGQPRGIDFHIATPEREEPRVVDVLPTHSVRPESHDALAQRQATVPPSIGSLAGMAFNAAVATIFDPPIANLRSVRAAGQSAAGGTGSARGLARLYAMCIGEVDGTPRLLSARTVALMSQLHAVGEDLVLGHQSRFGIIFQKADDRLWFGSHQAFGHDGAGGSIGIADPWHHLAYGYVPRRLTVPSGADSRGLGLARTVRECVTARET